MKQLPFFKIISTQKTSINLSFLAFLLIVLFGACTVYRYPPADIPQNDGVSTANYPPSSFSPDEGVIRVYTCSRGCFQYVLESGRTRFFPVNLAEAFKVDGLRVVYEATMERGTTVIKTAGPDDRPVPAFEARNVFIRNMRRL